MTRQCILFLMASVVFAGTAGASVQKGDMFLDLLGGYLSESGENDFSAWLASGSFNYFLSNYLSVGVGAIGGQVQTSGGTLPLQVDVGMGEPLDAELFDVDRDITMYGVGANIKLYIRPTGKIVPYVGLQLNWLNAEIKTSGSYRAETLPDAGINPSDPGMPFEDTSDTSGMLWGPIFGARIEINEYNDFFVEGQYHMFEGDVKDFIENGFGIFLGIIHQIQ
jgi:hypothetical protein